MPLIFDAAGDGIAFLVAGGIVYEIIAKDCSSPQTAEINIRKREETLMKWVHVGQIEGALMLAVAAIIDRKHRKAILAGGILAMVITELEYVHARSAGKASANQSETEEY